LRVAQVAVLGCVPFLAGCGGGENPVLTPVGWWHDLQGGEIAATRPPPPGADLPYPHLGTIPPKPTPPTESFRKTVQAELTQDRDSTERLAARTPIDLAVVPPPVPKPPVAPAPGGETANATLPAADAPPPKAPAAVTVAPDGGPAPGTPLTFVGAPPDAANLPDIPAAPPPPPSFVAVPAQPAPARLPAVLPAPASVTAGTRVLFATQDATLAPSQMAAVRDIVERRGKATLAVEGHGEAAADTPGAQQAALELGLKRAQAIADALTKQHVPPANILLSATSFGRDATITLQ
jgi:outer membrane protein OmpA-like peptidoglycan-associated protein